MTHAEIAALNMRQRKPAISRNNDRSFLTLAARNGSRFDPCIARSSAHLISPFPILIYPPSRPPSVPRWTFRFVLGHPEWWWEHVYAGAASRRREIQPTACTYHYMYGWISTIGRPLLSWRHSVVSRLRSWSGVGRRAVSVLCCVSLSLYRYFLLSLIRPFFCRLPHNHRHSKQQRPWRTSYSRRPYCWQ